MAMHPRSEREARRALLRDALVEFHASTNARNGADELLRALDAYLDDERPLPSTSPARPGDHDSDRAKGLMALLVTIAIVATVLVVVVADGFGWPVVALIAAIWIGTAVTLVST